MATTNLITTGYGDLVMQHGNGTPSHTEKRGSLYTDKDTGILYQNSNGATTWVAVGDEGTPEDMVALVVERTTNLALIGTIQEVAFDTTTTENDASVLEHDNTNTERLQIKTSGLHQIMVSFNCDNTSNALETLELELRIDGVAVQTIDLEISKANEELLTRMTAVELTAGTYITIGAKQLGGGGTDLTLKAKTVAYILKLQGTKGDKGDTGSGSNIIVQDEGITQGTVVDTLDFVGNGVVVTESAGKATVTIDNAWQPNSVPLLAVAASGASLFSNAGAGVYYSFSADDAIFFNDTLSKSNTTYDGSDLKMRLYCRLSSNGAVSDTVGLLLDYAFIRPGDNSSTTVTNVAQVNYDVSSEVQDEMFTIDLTTMTGVATAEILMFTLTRSGSGPGADTYPGNFELLGMELIIV